MTEELDKIEQDIKLIEAKIRLKKQLNDLEFLNDDVGYMILKGIIRIIENPLLLIVSIITFFIGLFIGGRFP